MACWPSAGICLFYSCAADRAQPQVPQLCCSHAVAPEYERILVCKSVDLGGLCHSQPLRRFLTSGPTPGSALCGSKGDVLRYETDNGVSSALLCGNRRQLQRQPRCGFRAPTGRSVGVAESIFVLSTGLKEPPSSESPQYYSCLPHYIIPGGLSPYRR